MYKLRHPLLLLLLLCLAPMPVLADDWPQWRGPNRDGVWNETGILKSFPPEGLKVRWRFPVGPGWSSPVVAGGRVYLTDSQITRPRARERVLCLAESTGKLLWDYPYDVDYPNWAYTPGQEGHITSTPIVRDSKVYTLGMIGHLFCLDAQTGKVIWQKNVEKDYQAEEFSCNVSLLIEGNLLILFIGGKPNACLVAFDKDSGSEVWRALSEPVTNSSPIVVTAAGKRQLIVWTRDSISSLEPATGKSYWRERFNTGNSAAVATPVWQKDLLLISGLMLRLDNEKPGARVLWPESKSVSQRVLSNTSTPLLRAGYVFSAKSSGHLVCLDARTGKEVWQTDKVTDLKNGASIHVTANGDSVLLYTDRGELIRAELTVAGYRELGRSRLVEPTFPFGNRKVAWPPPAYANGQVFARNDRELVCVSLVADPDRKP
jgi:outer membrane protein assembly factor BamB